MIITFNYLFILVLFRSYSVYFINRKSKKQTFLSGHFNICSSALVEYITEVLISTHFSEKTVCSWILFVFYFFLLEVILYFCNYIYIYKKIELINKHINHPIHLIITVSLPTFVCLWILPYKFSNFQTNLVIVCKSFIEISAYFINKYTKLTII